LQKNFENDVKNQNLELARCDYFENIVKYCDPEFIFNPKNNIDIQRDEKFKPLDSAGLAIQIKPQKLAVKLRPRK